MKTAITIIFLSFALILSIYSQDTIKIEPSIYYTKEEAKSLTRKVFSGKYSREDIVFSTNNKRIEYCYYEDSIRKCFGQNYCIVRDSILIIGDSIQFKENGTGLEEWVFKKLPNNNYLISKQQDKLYQFEEVADLIPLKHIGLRYTTIIENRDTLWTTKYTYLNNHPFGFEEYTFYESQIDDKIYEFNQIDIPPVQSDGNSLMAVTIDRTIACICEPMTDITTVSCVITKNGEIKNIEQAFGNISNTCPYSLMEIIKEIYSWKGIKPAYKNGNPVPVRWFITINNKSRMFMHAAFADTYKSRLEYIKYKRKK